MCGIAMLIFGIIALVKGQFTLSRTRVVLGAPARIVGVLLILPLPLGFALGAALGVWSAVHPEQLSQEQLQTYASRLDIALTGFFLIAALIVAVAFSGPPGPTRHVAEEEEDDFEEGRWRPQDDRSEEDPFRRRKDEHL